MKTCFKCKQTKELPLFSKDNKRLDGLQPYCKKCNADYVRLNKEKKKKYNKDYRVSNITALKENERIWYNANKSKKLESNRNRKRQRMKDDVLFRLSHNLSSRIRGAFKFLGKTKRAATLLGCSVEEAKKHIENQFQPGMAWDNYGYKTWHIDHIIPISSATTKEEMEKLCYYTNLQPLWALDNIIKSDSLSNSNL